MKFVAEKCLTAKMQQEVQQYFFEKEFSEEKNDEPVIRSNFSQKSSTSDFIIKKEKEILAQYDKLFANPKESKILKQLNENINKKYNQLAPNE